MCSITVTTSRARERRTATHSPTGAAYAATATPAFGRRRRRRAAGAAAPATTTPQATARMACARRPDTAAEHMEGSGRAEPVSQPPAPSGPRLAAPDRRPAARTGNQPALRDPATPRTTIRRPNGTDRL